MCPRDTSSRDRLPSYRPSLNDTFETSDHTPHCLSRRSLLATAGVALVGGAGCVEGENGTGDDDQGDDANGQSGNGTDGLSENGTDGQSENGSDTEDNGAVTDSEPSVLTWAITPSELSTDVELQYRPLFEYLESELDVEHRVILTGDYNATGEESRRGGINLAEVPPSAVVEYPDEFDVIGARAAFGSDRYFSLIATTPHSDVDELSDLEGEAVATGGPTSVSGGLFPLLLLNQAGLDTGGAPDGDPVDFTWRPTDHTTATQQLIQEPDVVAAGVGAFALAPHIPQEQFDEVSQEFVEQAVEYNTAGTRDPQLDLLAVSDPIPRAPLVSRPDWDDPLREEVEQALLDAPPEAFQHDEDRLVEELDAEAFDDPVVQDHLLWFDGVEPTENSDYGPFVDLVSALGVEPEELS